jgi:succinate dehydrogenase / fumarate reductase cytochrome b subunit
MIVRSFQQPAFALTYIVAMLMVGFHLFHAVGSMFQTIGVNHGSYNGAIRVVGGVVVGVLIVGNCSFPILVLAGVIGLPGS